MITNPTINITIERTIRRINSVKDTNHKKTDASISINLENRQELE